MSTSHGLHEIEFKFLRLLEILKKKFLSCFCMQPRSLSYAVKSHFNDLLALTLNNHLSGVLHSINVHICCKTKVNYTINQGVSIKLHALK